MFLWNKEKKVTSGMLVLTIPILQKEFCHHIEKTRFCESNLRAPRTCIHGLTLLVSQQPSSQSLVSTEHSVLTLPNYF